MTSTTVADFFKQLWKFVHVLLHYIGKVFLNIQILFRADKMKVDDNGHRPVRREFSEIPGPKGWPLIGNVLQFNKFGGAERFNTYAEKLHREYGDIVKVQLGPTNLVFVSNPAFYKEVARQEGTCPMTYKLPQTTVFTNEIYKKQRGLFFTDGEKWQSGRVLLTKLFLKDTGFMENIFEPYERIVTQALKQWLPISKAKDQTIPTVEIDCYSIFMKGMSSLCLGKDYEKFLKAADVDVDALARAAIELNISTEQLSKTPTTLARLLGLQAWKKFEEITLMNLHCGSKVTTIALEAMKLAENGGTLQQFGLIHRFKHHCQATDEEIKIHCADFLFDISEPVSLSLMWALQALGTSPDVQEKLFQEINSVTQAGEPVSFKHLDEMPYLRCVQKEISRIYPTAPFVARALDHEMVIGGYKVPSKTVLTISTIVSHHNPNYFPNPSRLWPERWFQSEDKEGLLGVTDQEAYHPWGIGKRACAGRLLSSAMVRIFIAQVVQNFILESEKEVEKIMRCVLYPDRELKIRVKARDNHVLKLRKS